MSERSSGLSSSTSTSSASRHSSQSPSAASKETLRACAKEPVHSWKSTRAPNERAISTVASVEPVSTITISSTVSATEARQRGSISCSSRTIMHKLRRMPVAGRARLAILSARSASSTSAGCWGVARPALRSVRRRPASADRLPSTCSERGSRRLAALNRARAASRLHSS